MTAEAGRAPLLDIKGLSVVYRTPTGDVRAVNDVDLALHAGEVVGLAGESGSGKSTLAYAAVRLLRAPAVITAGEVTYRGRRSGPDGVDVLAANAKQLRVLRWREISIVFQSAMNALNPVLRIEDQILDVLRAHLRISRDEQRQRVDTLLGMVGIPTNRRHSYPHELSGGMRQRVMIAMALAVEPEVVIMDEPTTALDVVVQREILAEIFRLKSEIGFAVLFITHDLSLLLEIADRVAIMYAGQLVEVGDAASILRHTSHPYTRGLLRSFPQLHGARQNLVGIPGSPPDLSDLPPGCPFIPRCEFAIEDCTSVDMRLIPVGGDAAHATACPITSPAQLAMPTTAPPAASTAASAAASAPVTS
jgi:oligopeptide/dipeptide ABC transporter ATP-binding protein